MQLFFILEVRVGPLGSTQGVNVVNLAFARPGYVGCWNLPTEEERDDCVLLPGYQGKIFVLRLYAWVDVWERFVKKNQFSGTLRIRCNEAYTI